MEKLTAATRNNIWAEVDQMWAIPSENLATPPPHSTQAAIDK